MTYKNKRCDLCGSLIGSNETFCKICGNVVVKDKDAPDAVIEDLKGNKINKKIDNKVIYIALGILAILLVIFLVN